MADLLSTEALELRACLESLDFDFAFEAGAAEEVRVTVTLFEFAVVRLMAVDKVGTEPALFLI
jgi:hypothetical protein